MPAKPRSRTCKPRPRTYSANVMCGYVQARPGFPIGAEIRTAVVSWSLVTLAVEEGGHGQQPPHVLVGAVERGQLERGAHPDPGDRLGSGELAQPVGAVNAAETGVAVPAERQRGHGHESEDRVDRGHAAAH